MSFHVGYSKPRPALRVGLQACLLGWETTIFPMVLAEHVLLEVTVLEKLDLMVDCKRNQLVLYHGTLDQPILRI
jgi:hypothetical protein